MSVIMVLRVAADVAAFESYASENAEQLDRIAEDGRSQGAIHHQFAANGDDELVVIDEWPDEASFQGFFEGQAEIPEIMGAVAKGEPDIKLFRKLDTSDAF